MYKCKTCGKESDTYYSLGAHVTSAHIKAYKIITERAKKKYYANVKYCKHCEKKLDYKDRRNIFCNHSCAASYNNKNKIKNSKLCKKCSNKISKRWRRYCDTCIEKKYNRPNKVWELKDAKKDLTRKKLLIEMRGHKCEKCLNTKWLNKPIPLNLHHKDGNSDNNEENNLQLLCSNCHSFTPYYKGKNTKRRIYRKEYYKKQKVLGKRC